MQTIYRNASPRTTRPESAFRTRRWDLVAYAAAVLMAPVTLASPAGAQTPVGMVEQPCLPPLPPASPVQTEAEIAARREAMAERRRLDWGGLCRHRAANAALEGHAVDAVFLGDSITEFWEAASSDLFQGSVVNRGIGAQTSPQLLLRFQQDVIGLHPRVVHLMIGTNDVAGNTGPSRPEDFKNNVRSMVELAQAHGIAVVIGAIPPVAVFSWRPELKPAARIAELNAWLEDYARTRGAVFVDYHAAMRGPDGEMRSEFTSDGVHPDAEGYAVMTPMALAALATAKASAD